MEVVEAVTLGRGSTLRFFTISLIAETNKETLRYQRNQIQKSTKKPIKTQDICMYRVKHKD